MFPRAALICAVLCCLTAVLPASASAERAFAQRFGTNDVGDITIAANTLMTCPSSCAAEHETTIPTSGSVNADNNNNYTMARVDVDSDPATFDSSTATLHLPAGAQVLFAGLYWSADTVAGTGVGATDAPDTAARGTMRLKAPGGAYQTVTADQLDDQGTRYQGFADVTSLVEAAGGGLYEAADVQSATGQDRYAGWSLVVAYHDDAGSAHNLTIFDGLRILGGGTSSISIPVSGFHTTPTGTVATTLGAVAYEGDLGLTGDGMTLDGQTISDALNPAANVFDSTISVRGVRVLSGRNPAQENTFGLDADLLSADGLLANGATSATIGLTTGGETYYAAVLTFSSALLAPHIRTTTSVTDLNGGQIEPGDILEYTIDGTNDGTDDATHVVLTTSLPPGLQWVDGSLQIVSGAGAGTLTEAAGDDRGAWDAGGRIVTWFLGTGANPSTGGTVPVSGSFRTRFRVQVSTTPDGGSIAAPGVSSYDSATTPSDTYDLSGTGGSITVHSADLAMAVAHSGQLVRGDHVDYTLTATNGGSGATHGQVTVVDDLPSDLVPDGTPSGNGWTCDVSGRHVSCTRSDSLASGDAYPPITVPARVAASAGATLADAATVSGGGDGVHGNDTGTDSAAPSSRVDVAVAISPPDAAPIAGAPYAFSALVGNLGPSTATGVKVVVPVPTGLSGAQVTLAGGTGSCTVADGTATCVVDAIAAGGQVAVQVHGTVAQDAANFPLLMTATATADQTDVDHGNDQASAATSVGTDSNLGLAVLAPDSPVLIGQTVDFSLSVSNAGPSDAHDVVVVQDLPPGAQVTDLDSRCTVTGHTVTCALGTIPAGQAIVLEFVAKADQPFDGATLGRHSRVTSSTGDGDLSNNAAVRPAGRCLSRRNFDIRLRVPLASRRIVVKVGGRPARVWRRSGRVHAKVDLRGRLTSRVTVRIAAITPRGFRISGSRRYRTCDIRRASKRPPRI